MKSPVAILVNRAGPSPDFAFEEEAGASGRRTNKGMRALSVLAALSFVSIALVGCAAEAESTGPAPIAVVVAAPGGPVAEPSEAHAAVTPPGSDPVRPTGSEVVVPAAHEQPSGFVCRAGAFCEDFEEQGFESHWGSALTTGTGTVDHGTASASLGRGSIRLVTGDDTSSAYLLEQHGTVKGNWSGVLGFAFRVAAVPSRYLGGPELTLRTADGPISVRVTMEPKGVFIEQRSTSECLQDRCVPKRTLIAPAHPNHWYRVTLGFEVNPAKAGTYGRLEASVDDSGVVVSTDLSVPFYDGDMVFSAGITQGDVGGRSIADLDDVTLLVR
ncbi:MAG: hypothetical protein JWO86_9163 [Myxococcaceae bacterium]|nr:hypothetical protein [Myxococcaceae bacterium]